MKSGIIQMNKPFPLGDNLFNPLMVEGAIKKLRPAFQRQTSLILYGYIRRTLFNQLI